MYSNIVAMTLAQTAVLIKNYEQKSFTSAQTRNIFKPIINHLIFVLMNQSNKDDIMFVLRKASDILPVTYFKVNLFLFQYFAKFSLLPMRIYNKVDNFFSKIVEHFKKIKHHTNFFSFYCEYF